MSWIIYKIDPDGGHKLYVTDIYEDSVGHFGGPGAQEEACEWKDQADAQRALDWLNDPETFYGQQATHILEHKP
jgi:hypothetical protein